jgi:excisionase family DNA binding protein
MPNQNESPVKEPRQKLIPERKGNELLFSKGEFAAELRISTRTVNNLISEGKIRATKIGRRCLIHRKELEKIARLGAA